MGEKLSQARNIYFVIRYAQTEIILFNFINSMGKRNQLIEFAKSTTLVGPINTIHTILRKTPKFHDVEIFGNTQLLQSFGQFAFRPKFCSNCAFPQNFGTTKLVEITVFYAVPAINRLKYNLY